MRSDLGNLLKALGRLDEAKVSMTYQQQTAKYYFYSVIVLRLSAAQFLFPRFLTQGCCHAQLNVYLSPTFLIWLNQSN